MSQYDKEIQSIAKETAELESISDATYSHIQKIVNGFMDFNEKSVADLEKSTMQTAIKLKATIEQIDNCYSKSKMPELAIPKEFASMQALLKAQIREINSHPLMSSEDFQKYIKAKEREEDPKTLQMLQEQIRNLEVHASTIHSTSDAYQLELYDEIQPNIDFEKIWEISSFFMPASLKKKVFEPAFEDLKQDLLLSGKYKKSNPRAVKCGFMAKTAWMYLDCLYTAITSKVGQTVLAMLPDGLRKFWRNQ